MNAGGVTLRLRPFILGMTDLKNEYLDLIKLAKEHGTTAVSTEFMCIESRADAPLKLRYDEMSKIVGYNVLDFYSENSYGSGYIRLNRNIKFQYMMNMQERCRKLGLRFYVSDAHFKELCSNGSCCGLPPDWNYSRGQFTEALMIAKEKGKVRFSDIRKKVDRLHSGYLWDLADGYNTRGTVMRAGRIGWTMADYIHWIWNHPNSLLSPYKYFAGVLFPIGLDSDGDVIYEYRKWRKN